MKVSRKVIYEELMKENIGVNVHYIPVHKMPYYQQLGYGKETYPVAEKLYEEILTLPLFPKMSVDDINDVITAVIKILNHYRK